MSEFVPKNFDTVFVNLCFQFRSAAEPREQDGPILCNNQIVTKQGRISCYIMSYDKTDTAL